MGFEVMEAAVPLEGVFVSCVIMVLIGIAGGTSGAMVGRGGSGAEQSGVVTCVCIEGPGENNGPACGVLIILCPPKNHGYGIVGRMRPFF